MKPVLFPLMLLLTLCACGSEIPAEESIPSMEENLPITEEEQNTPVLSPEEETIEALLSSMTIEEKVGQMFFVRCPDTGAEEDIMRYHPGGILLFGQDYKDADGNYLTQEQFCGKLQSYQDASDLPLFIGSDEEGGTVTRASRNPNLFPEKRSSPQEIYTSGGANALVRETYDFNRTLLSYGINVNFAPVADVATDPSSFIYARTLGQNAETTASLVASIVTAMNDAGVGSVLKHFPGYGNNVDTHTGIAVDERPYEQFLSEDFLPFKAGIAAGAPSVLVSHNIVKSMDETLPASLSAPVHQILREDLAFDGVIMTDDLAMDALKEYAENGSVAVLAVLAGNDMLVTTDYWTQIPQVIEAVENGTISEEKIDNSVRRILQWKIDLDLLEIGA